MTPPRHDLGDPQHLSTPQGHGTLADWELHHAEHEARTSDAESTLKGYVIGAMGVSLVPLPLVDLAALLALQLKLVAALSHCYGLTFSHHVNRALLVGLMGSSLPLTTTVTASSLLKLFPGIGHLAGGASMSILSGASTYAVGRVFIEYFEAGEAPQPVNARSMKSLFHREFKQGQTVATQLMSEHTLATSRLHTPQQSMVKYPHG